jgi:hypothetical protein
VAFSKYVRKGRQAGKPQSDEIHVKEGLALNGPEAQSKSQVVEVVRE